MDLKRYKQTPNDEEHVIPRHANIDGVFLEKREQCRRLDPEVNIAYLGSRRIR